MKKNRRPLVLTMLALVAAMLLLASCVPAAPPPPPPPDLKPVNFCLSVQQSEIQEVATDEGFISDQVVLTGPRESLDTVAEKEKLTLIQICPLDSIAYDPENANDPNNPNNPDALVIGLYQIQQPSDPGRTPKELVESINNNPDYPQVEADLNYLVTSSASGSCADPYSIGGSPYSIGGSPNTTLNENAASDQLLTQWSLRNIGLTYKPPMIVNQVHVAIFDTAPSIMVPGQVGMSTFQKALEIEWPNAANNDKTFYLKVYDFLGNNTQISSSSGNPAPPDSSSHGLFVAGEVRIIAPESQFHLIRILGENGCGDSFRLGAAINTFMALMKSNGITKEVINLSLTARQLNSQGVPYLKAALDHAYQDGAVIVAAVGNDSTPSTIIAAQIPANYDFVIGVVSANRDGSKSCYSNKGSGANKDTSAPGGDAGTDPVTKSPCASRTLSWDKNPDPCTTMGDCRYMLISLINPTLEPGTGRFLTKTGGWSGTSFAAPLVSGAAARAYDQSTNQDEVYCRIQKGSTTARDSNLGWGIINIPNILADKTCSGSTP